MKKLLSLVSATALLISMSFASAYAGSAKEMMMSMQDKMACSANCASDYNQCVRDGSDYSFSAENLAERTKMNVMAPLECASANRECNASC